MSIEKLSDGLWVPSTDAQIEQWREKGYPYMQDTCLNRFTDWCKGQGKEFDLIVDVGAWCGTWTLSMRQYAKKIHCYDNFFPEIARPFIFINGHSAYRPFCPLIKIKFVTDL